MYKDWNMAHIRNSDWKTEEPWFTVFSFTPVVVWAENKNTARQHPRWIQLREQEAALFLGPHFH